MAYFLSSYQNNICKLSYISEKMLSRIQEEIGLCCCIPLSMHLKMGRENGMDSAQSYKKGI